MKKLSLVLIMGVFLLFSLKVSAFNYDTLDLAKQYEMSIVLAMNDRSDWEPIPGDLAGLNITEEYALGTFKDNCTEYGFSESDYTFEYYYDEGRDKLIQFCLSKTGKVSYGVWTSYGTCEEGYIGDK